jgi:hypothetical protein
MHPMDADIVVRDIPKFWTSEMFSDWLHNLQSLDGLIVFHQVNNTKKGDSRFARVWISECINVVKVVNAMIEQAHFDTDEFANCEYEFIIDEAKMHTPYKVALSHIATSVQMSDIASAINELDIMDFSIDMLMLGDTNHHTGMAYAYLYL